LSKLPSISGSQAVRAFERLGYEVDRQRGSHLVLRHTGSPHRRLVVPNHQSVAKGTLRALIREAGLTVEEFRNAL
jgi:predicted RNA binding protein YcfA (HicA-like mRNA interferase family)